MDELSTGITTSLELRSEGRLDAADDALRAVVNRECPLRMGRTRSDIFDAVAGASRTPERFDTLSSDLVSQLELVPYNICDHRSWLVLTRVLIAHRFFVASEVTRGNARKSVLHAAATGQGGGGDRMDLLATRAAIDLGDLELARYFLARLGPQAKAEPIEWYLRRCSGMSAPSLADSADAGRSRSVRFGRLVSGRTVAVVGPAPTEHPQGAEIDDFDVIVRINYWGAQHLAPAAEAGSRTDVSYYNWDMGEQLVNLTDRGFVRDLEFVVFKNSDHAVRSSRAACSPGACFFNGHPNMIPVAVFDLMQFEPARLKVFGVNFFLSKQTHHDSYVGAPVSGSTSPWSLAEHDMCVQVNFMKNLSRAGALEADGMGAAVLAMDNSEYLSRMESNYRPQ